MEVILALAILLPSCNLTPEQQAGMRAAAQSMNESNQQAAYHRQPQTGYVRPSSYDRYQNQLMQQDIRDIRQTQMQQQYYPQSSGVPYIPHNDGVSEILSIANQY